jgi:hypothetical protein
MEKEVKDVKESGDDYFPVIRGYETEFKQGFVSQVSEMTKELLKEFKTILDDVSEQGKDRGTAGHN